MVLPCRVSWCGVILPRVAVYFDCRSASIHKKNNRHLLYACVLFFLRGWIVSRSKVAIKKGGHSEGDMGWLNLDVAVVGHYLAARCKSPVAPVFFLTDRCSFSTLCA